ncbi:MAG: hypothetical protein KME32_30105 [Mojavia pulchra JT2-VF2]|jgi:hypothetical protein|uniref:Uncharacterized protein n=1 Tax=Mojavia pulchra JT2-VF2 TaxID=287848 RepID=A0A951UKC2_9NOST|nr:hypothetical protein [Mojavia pulchra JT2-VF2]
MDTSKKYNQQMEINDLIADAVTNAVTRRGLLGTEEGLLGLSDHEAASIAGGLTSETTITKLKPIDPVIAGMIALPDDPPVKPICEPIIVGLIAVDPPEEIA